MMAIGPETLKVLECLRQSADKSTLDNDWCDVYLDNAKPAGMKAATFRSYLAKLSQEGEYRPIDGYAWGKVKMGVQS